MTRLIKMFKTWTSFDVVIVRSALWLIVTKQNDVLTRKPSVCIHPPKLHNLQNVFIFIHKSNNLT